MRILVTRPEEDAAPLARELEAMGVEPVAAPMMSIRYLDGPALDLDGVQALLVTSANGARALAGRSSRRDLPALAVGDASARAARELGFKNVESASGDVEALAELAKIRLDPEAGALLHPAGTKVAGDLGGMLNEAGFEYRREVLYESRTATALDPDCARAIREGRADGVMLFSPRTAATFARLAEKAGVSDACASLEAYCLSQAVAEKLSKLE